MSMNQEIDNLMIELAAGELQGAERERIEALIQGNADLERRFHRYQLFFDAVRAGGASIFMPDHELCPDRDILVRLYDSPDTIDANTRAAMSRHVSACDTCREIMNGLEVMDQRLAAEPDDPRALPAVPDALQTRLRTLFGKTREAE